MSKLKGQRPHRWRTFFIVAVVSALTAACGSSSHKASAGGGGASGSGNKVITVGGVFPRTGAYAPSYVGAYETADAFFKNIDASGGVDGYTFKFVGLDSQGNPSVAAADYQQLIKQDHADILISGDDITLPAAVATIKANDIPLIGCVTADACYQNPGMYPVLPWSQGALGPVTQKFLSTEHVTKADVLVVDIPQGIVGQKLVSQAYLQSGIQVPLSTAFPLTTVDFTALVARAKASGADHIFLAFNAAQLQPFFQSEIQQGYHAQLLITGFSSLWPSQLGSAANGLIVTVPTGSLFGAGKAGDNAAAIVRKYYPSIDLLSRMFGTDSWMAGEAIVQAVKDLHGTPATPASLISALNGFKNWQGTFNPPLTYGTGANGDPAHCMQVLEIQGGTWVAPNGRFTCWTQSTAPASS